MYVLVECPKCKATRRIGPGEVPEGEMPMCDACLFPMLAKKVVG